MSLAERVRTGHGKRVSLTPFVSRKFGPLELRVGAPTQNGGAYVCAYEVDAFGKLASTKTVLGADSLQAFELAIFVAVQELRELARTNDIALDESRIPTVRPSGPNRRTATRPGPPPTRAG